MKTQDQGQERRFTIAVQYWLPIWRAFEIEAATPEVAMEKAIAGAGGWDGIQWNQDYEGSSNYAVSCIAAGSHENPYDAAPSDFLTAPARLRGATVKEVDGLPALIEAAQAIVSACGGNPPDWLAAEVAQLADALARAGAD